MLETAALLSLTTWALGLMSTFPHTEFIHLFLMLGIALLAASIVRRKPNELSVHESFHAGIQRLSDPEDR